MPINNNIVEHHKNYTCPSVFRSSVSGEVLTRNVKIIAEGLARHIFNMTENNTVSEIILCSTQTPSLSSSLRLQMAFVMYTRTSCGRG